MSTDDVHDVLLPGESARHPDPLEDAAHRDGWAQRLGAPPATYPRHLTGRELAAWDAGHAAAHRSRVCVHRVDEPLRPPAAVPPADTATAAAVSALPLLELPASPPAPYFDGTQLCAQVDPELFFPEKGQNATAAKRLCGMCEFLNPCRRYALTASAAGYPITGIWGGTNTKDRVYLRRAAAAGTLDVDASLVDERAEDVA